MFPSLPQTCHFLCPLRLTLSVGRCNVNRYRISQSAFHKDWTHARLHIDTRAHTRLPPAPTDKCGGEGAPLLHLREIGCDHLMFV